MPCRAIHGSKSRATSSSTHRNFSKGQTLGPIEQLGPTPNRRGTTVSFVPDTEIFGERQFSAKRLFKLARSKAYLFAGVEIRWKCAESLAGDDVPAEAVFKFPGGLADHLAEQLGGRECVTAQPFAGNQDFPEEAGRVEWAIAWPLYSDGSTSWYCNTVPTPDGGTHEQGLRAALVKGLRAFGELTGVKKAKDLTADDVMTGAEVMLSVFIRDPQFQSQTKDRLTSPEAARLVENAVRDHFDHFLADNMDRGKALLGQVMERMDERLKRKQEREIKRKTATNAKKLRLPGKLTDCSGEGERETELFHRRRRQRRRQRQASARPQDAGDPADSRQDPECRVRHGRQDPRKQRDRRPRSRWAGTRKDCDAENLRYDRIIIMTDADVDGAHIATLLMTFFFQEMAEVVRGGHLYLAQPPLYRLTAGKESRYARDDAHRAELEATVFKGKKVDVGRFKGLGEMNPAQLRETTMNPDTRSLVRITLPQEFEQRAVVKELVDQLMGRNPEHRFNFIQNNAGDMDRDDRSSAFGMTCSSPSSVRCTGHLSAIAMIRSRCSASSASPAVTLR